MILLGREEEDVYAADGFLRVGAWLVVPLSQEGRFQYMGHLHIGECF